MVKAARISEPVPFSAINVTPFIDVMLVLLIVMILSIPNATHKVPITLPVDGGATEPEQPHKLAIDSAGALFWDGGRISDAELPARLTALRADAAGVLHMQTDPDARYDRFDAVLAVVKRAGVEKLGFVGNQPLPD
ncbi:biopolymer transport protein ExbD [Sphingomonas naasensis]|uniref:Biopolymer transporter ExbD n=1 Tax=Sphingomonas naasensis TaxID=1344951 RepID=A0A4S1WKN4_9SPHN|nr:biopolymer transporter ExbD [Sphingomonas naasensis]NIJ21878.1 biopolymer transport protein ExbD [Sphingomonas naasensis]TGX42427.1 biopolymer transporter ExbD [Sphingomonas naasensis]